MAALALAGIVVVGGMAPTPVGAVDLPCTITWTGAAGGGLWSTAGNWTPATGPARTPTTTDVVCATGGAPAATVDAPFSVVQVQWQVVPTVPLVVSDSLTATADVFVDALTLNSGDEITANHVQAQGTTTVPHTAGTGPAVVSTVQGFSSAGLDVTTRLDILGGVGLMGTTTVGAGGAIHLGDPEDPDDPSPPSVDLLGTLDLRGGGTVDNVGPIDFAAHDDSQILGPPPTFRRARVALADAVTVIVTDRSSTGQIAEGATLRVVPTSPATTPDLDISNLDPLEGTLVLDGTPEAEVLVQGGDIPFENDGAVLADHARIRTSIVNRGLLRFGAGTRLEYGSAFAVPHRNEGDLVLDGPATVAGELRTTGEIRTGTAQGELLIDSVLVVGGVIDAPVRTTDGGVLAEPGRRPGIRRIDITDGSAGIQVGGYPASATGTVRSRSTVAISDDTDVGLYPVSGYQTCAGDRFPVVSARGLVEDGRVVPQGLEVDGPAPAGVTFRTRTWGVVAVATVDAGSPAFCRLSVGERFTTLVFTEALKRVASAEDLATFVPRTRTEAGQIRAAQTILETSEAVLTRVDDDYGRILGSPADEDGRLYWYARLFSGGQPRRLRAQLLGSPAFYQQAGGTASGFADALYRSELGRPAGAAARQWVASRLAAGDSRSQVAWDVLGTVEGRRATAARLVERWHGRPATAQQQATWATQLATVHETIVTTRIAAAAPGT